MHPYLDLDLPYANARLRLLPAGAVYWEAASTLIVADPHLGKSEEFRAARIPVPDGETATDLRRLRDLVLGTAARRLLILGDLFHGRAATSAPMMEHLLAWRRELPDLVLELVPGNHDRHTRDWPAALGIRRLPEGAREKPFRWFHFPPVSGEGEGAGDGKGEGEGFYMAGHVHPAVRLREDGGPPLVLPCFHRTPGGMILPAFGSFTGTARIEPKRGDRIYAVVEGRVVEIPPALCR